MFQLVCQVILFIALITLGLLAAMDSDHPEAVIILLLLLLIYLWICGAFSQLLGIPNIEFHFGYTPNPNTELIK